MSRDEQRYVITHLKLENTAVADPKRPSVESIIAVSFWHSETEPIYRSFSLTLTGDEWRALGSPDTIKLTIEAFE